MGDDDDDLSDAATAGRGPAVNVESNSYRVAREYMIRLDRQDLEDPGKLRPVAAACGLTPEAFRDRYGYLTED
jgi:ATP-dependent phosphofructokinase / diphosphate-dependent phosphofructokinase